MCEGFLAVESFGVIVLDDVEQEKVLRGFVGEDFTASSAQEKNTPSSAIHRLKQLRRALNRSEVIS